jgi:hypothetical protein
MGRSDLVRIYNLSDEVRFVRRARLMRLAPPISTTERCRVPHAGSAQPEAFRRRYTFTKVTGSGAEERPVGQGSLESTMVPERRGAVSQLTRGRRCAECRRYLFTFHHPRRAAGRQWEHLRCEGLEPPDPMDFAELAEVLVARNATTRTRQLRAELTAIRNEFSRIRVRHLGVERRGGEQDDHRGMEAADDVAELSARCGAIHEELLERLRRRARTLHVEWMLGTDADGKTTAVPC